MKIDDRTAQTDPRVMERKAIGAAWNGVVIHHSADQGISSEEGTVLWLSRYHDNPVSCHQLIKRDGTIVKIVPETHIAYCNGYSCMAGRNDCNNWCLSIELANRGNGEPYTDAQYEALSATLAYNMALYHIPDDHVDSHRRVRDNWIEAHPIMARLRKVARKNDPLGLIWERVWQGVDAYRFPGSWPAEWNIPRWYRLAPRIVIT